MANFIPDTQETFTFLWRVDVRLIKFMSTTNHTPAIEFTIPQLQNTTWNLKTYFEGEDEEGNNSLGCCLQRVDDKEPTSMYVDFSLYTIPMSSHHRGKYMFCQFTKRNLSKVKCYGPCKPIDISLTIVLSIKYNRSELTISEDYVPLCWDILHVFRSITGYSRPLEYRMTYPRNRFVQRKNYFEPAQVSHPVNCSVINGNQRMQIHPTILSDSISVVFASVINTGIDTLSFELLFINYSAKCVRMTCQVGMRIGEVSHVIVSEEHIFYSNLTVDDWRLNKTIECSEILEIFSRNQSHSWQWTFNLTFSTSGLQCEISEKWIQFRISPYHIRDSPLSRFMHSLQIVGPCDFIVKVNGINFIVHKFILGSLTRLFYIGLQRKDDAQFATVEGVEEDVVEEMLYFLYSGTFRKAEFKTMKAVFLAAVYYEIDTLRDKCRNYLISQLNRQNADQIQHLSSITDDDPLKEAVKYYKNNFLGVDESNYSTEPFDNSSESKS